MPVKPCRLVLVAVALLASVAHADAVYVSIQPRAVIGKGLPTLNVEIRERIAGFELKLKRSDGKAINVRGGGPPGVTRTIDLTQPLGKFSYTGELWINLPNGSSSSMPLEFEAELFTPLKMTLKKEDLDLKNRRAIFRLSHPASKAHVKVVMETGRVAMDSDVTFNAEAAGTPLEVSWPEAEGKVMLIHIQGYDTEGFFDGNELTPGFVSIPHEEVNFDTGKWDIRRDEEAKVDRTVKLVFEAISKFGQYGEVKLYVAGHTDSVGTNASNRTLSLNRAKSIGAYFRKRGIRIPIFYEGFGEEALLVATPDETDEPKNRRAEYIISYDTPEMKNTDVPVSWKRL